MESAVVQRLGEKEVKDGAVRIEVDGALKERMRALEPARGFFGDTALYQRFEIFGIQAKPFFELLQAALEYSAFTVGDLEISAGNAHSLVQRERARERDDGFVRQSFAEIKNAEVVVRAGIRGVDSPCERPQDFDLSAFRGCQWAGSCRWGHLLSLRAPRGRLHRTRSSREPAERIRAGSRLAPRERIPSLRKGWACWPPERGRPESSR